jgi:hypothetical protein
VGGRRFCFLTKDFVTNQNNESGEFAVNTAVIGRIISYVRCLVVGVERLEEVF